MSQFLVSGGQSIGTLSFRAHVNLKKGSIYFLESGFPSLHPTGTFLNESFTDFLPADFHIERWSQKGRLMNFQEMRRVSIWN